jgi:Fe-S cluster assembly protein SufD
VSSRTGNNSWDHLVALAKQRIEVTPIPDRTNEAWHYGDPRKFDIGDLNVGTQLAASASDQATKTDAASCVPTGLIESDHFAAQHFSRSQPPQYLNLIKHKQHGEIHIHLAAQPGGVATAHTLFLTAEAFAEAEVFIHCSGGSAEQRDLHSVMLFAYIADGANISVTRVQHYGSRTDALLREYATVGRDATYTSNVVQLGGLNLRSEAHVELAQPGANAFLRGAYLASGRQRFDFLTHQNHQAPNATSNLLYKGALLGRARASYQGMITVAPDAQRTDAYQSNRTLVLSGSARADSSPQLEIGANDVRCTHGSTVSNVSDSELFYMQSRGIPREVARRLLIAAFIAEVTDQIGNQRITDLVEQHLTELSA